MAWEQVLCEEVQGECLEIDSRSSDAIALSVRAKASIYAEESLFDTIEKLQQPMDSAENYQYKNLWPPEQSATE